jgi:Flp pilus assembly protein TadB
MVPIHNDISICSCSALAGAYIWMWIHKRKKGSNWETVNTRIFNVADAFHHSNNWNMKFSQYAAPFDMKFSTYVTGCTVSYDMFQVCQKNQHYDGLSWSISFLWITCCKTPLALYYFTMLYINMYYYCILLIFLCIRPFLLEKPN